MKIIEKFKSKKPVISFEVFPPKPETSPEKMNNQLEEFAKLKPDFISVTYGAGGSSKDNTFDVCSKIKNSFGIECMSHFTSVGHSIDEVNAILKDLKSKNIENILALRGDHPLNQPDFDFGKNIFKYGSELVEHVKTSSDFCIAAAAYPEGHVNSKKIRDDLENLKHKVDQGVDFLVTQLFFDNRIFYNFLDWLGRLGINCPVNPGIMPIFKAEQIKKIAALCGASMPAKLILIMDKYAHNPEDLANAGIEFASEQIRDLLDNNVDGIHFLTMNKPNVTKTIMQNVSLLKDGK